MKTGTIIAIAVGSVVTLGGLSYFLLSKKNKQNMLSSNPDNVNPNQQTTKAICNYSAMQNGECDVESKEYAEFLKKAMPRATGFERWQLALAGLGISDSNTKAMYDWIMNQTWITSQAKEKVSKGINNDLTNARLLIGAWHEWKRLYNLSQGKYKIISNRLLIGDKIM